MGDRSTVGTRTRQRASDLPPWARHHFVVPVQKGRAKAREQHEKRGKDEPFPPEDDSTKNTAKFVLGPAVRPAMHFDHGFLDDGHGGLDKSKMRAPTWDDYKARVEWIAMLEGAELLRPDLVDATSAYRHFLFGNGVERPFDYERFLQNDSSGARVLRSIMEDVRGGAIELDNVQRPMTPPAPRTDEFDMCSGVVSVGSPDLRYPYAATENWQKAIGAHLLWISAHVIVRTDPARNLRSFGVETVIHVEDQYNFNPDNVDIATGMPDSANGRFELTGLGHEFHQIATATRGITFDAPIGAARQSASTGSPLDAGRTPRTRTPSDSRR